jgi:hypothetical protein
MSRRVFVSVLLSFLGFRRVRKMRFSAQFRIARMPASRFSVPILYAKSSRSGLSAKASVEQVLAETSKKMKGVFQKSLENRASEFIKMKYGNQTRNS